MSYIINFNKICIHKYLTVINNEIQSPGFADYLRGTIALFKLSQIYNYKLLLDNSHPLFKYFKENDNIITNNLSSDTIILLPPLSYDNIYNILNNIFQKNESFIVMTNSFYNLNDEILSNWGDISEYCKSYIKNTFIPSIELKNKIEHIINLVYNLKNENFKVIHIRFGDDYIHNNTYNINSFNLYYEKINNIINNDKYNKYVLITDSSIIGNKLKDNIKELYYWNNKKVHIGDLINNNDESLLDTLTDFFIMSKSIEIISNGSGFSTIISLLYNIKYTII
jgi:hypothetical protein